jgi:hypothetical protein
MSGAIINKFNGRAAPKDKTMAIVTGRHYFSALMLEKIQAYNKRVSGGTTPEAVVKDCLVDETYTTRKKEWITPTPPPPDMVNEDVYIIHITIGDKTTRKYDVEVTTYEWKILSTDGDGENADENKFYKSALTMVMNFYIFPSVASYTKERPLKPGHHI